jgi:hypothetical protein
MQIGNLSCHLFTKLLQFHLHSFCNCHCGAKPIFRIGFYIANGSKTDDGKADGIFVKLLNGLEKTSLLILDDFGLAPMDQNTRLALLQILEYRYGKKSILIASPIPINKGHEAIYEPGLADAIMDRLMANAHRFELKRRIFKKKKQIRK